MTVLIYVRRNSDLARIGQIDQYQSLQMNLKFNLPSPWMLTLASTTPLVDSLKADGGIVVERDGEVLLSGPVRSYSREENADGDSFTISGFDDSTWLSSSIVFPSAFPFTSDAYDDFTDVAETALHHFVDKNIGPNAWETDQEVPGLVMGPDLARGTSVTGKGRVQILNDLLTQLALTDDLRYQIVQVGDDLQFLVYQPEDKTASVQFSQALGNLSSFVYERSAPVANYIVAGGAGEGTSRVFRRGSDAASIAEWGRRIEMFRDRRDTAITAEIDQTITEELAVNSETESLGIVPIDTRGVQFGRDYNLGDRVRIITRDGTVIENAIREILITYTAEGESVQPVVGTPGATHPRMDDIYKERKYVERRTQDLERV